jgi:hypothetical protein
VSPATPLRTPVTTSADREAAVPPAPNDRDSQGDT